MRNTINTKYDQIEFGQYSSACLVSISGDL